jgi:hypothetical protein
MAKYWTNHQRFEGITQFANFIETTMHENTFSKVKCPVFVGYYYKDEENQDKVVSVAAMRTMLEQLGTPPLWRREKAFPEADDHVIASHITSSDWVSVRLESERFLREVLRLP